MPNSIFAEGRTTNEAIENGLKQLNAKREDVIINVIGNEEKRSFFSILEVGLHARNLRIFCIPSLSHFSRFFFQRRIAG